jgi:sigma-E factor negative regulatory protein RseC
MITEAGRVVAVEPDCLWVETMRQSTCNSCSAQKGCGHGLMNKLGSGRAHHVRAILKPDSSQSFQLNDQVEIAVPEKVLVSGALLVYLLPLLMLMAGALLSSHWNMAEPMVVLGAAVGFALGLLVVRFHAWKTRNDQHLQPQVVGLKPAEPTIHATMHNTTESLSLK